MIAHPTEELPRPELAVVVAGPALYLLGHVLFRLRMAGSLCWKRSRRRDRLRRRRGARARSCPRLWSRRSIVAVLVAVIGAERLAAARRRARGEPSPLERLEHAR